MSIPKEPRQLMINLMYLVLTAMLALNVSAEIFHAFDVLDSGLGDSSDTVERSNQKLIRAIEQQIDAYPQYEPYRTRVRRTQQLRAELTDWIADLRSELLDAAGGLDEQGIPVRARDKDLPTRLLVENGRGAQLEARVRSVRDSLLALLPPAERDRLQQSIPLRIGALPARAETDSWSEFTFRQMPVAAVLPILSKFENDTHIAETTVLNHFFNALNVSDVKADRFAAVVSADRSYVIRGEQYRSEIFLSSYSSSADNLEITVDGRRLPVRDGRAIFEAPAGSVGKRQHRAVVTVTNPLDGRRETFERTFAYEVGERSVTVSADKMNVLYVGVDNPISISAAGVPSHEVKVRAQGLTLTPTANGRYTATATRPGAGSITVSGGGLEPTTFPYRIKRIPDPVVKLGKKPSGSIGAAEFRAQRGLIPWTEGFDWDARCSVDGFTLTRVRKGDAARATNRGSRFTDTARQLVEGAQRDDLYYFDAIKVRCPGDAVGRSMPALVFTIR